MEKWTYGLVQVTKDDETHYMMDAPWLKGDGYAELGADNIQMREDGDTIVFPIDKDELVPFKDAFFMKMRPEVVLKDTVLTLRMDGSFFDEEEGDTLINIDLPKDGTVVLASVEPTGVVHPYMFTWEEDQIVVKI